MPARAVGFIDAKRCVGPARLRNVPTRQRRSRRLRAGAATASGGGFDKIVNGIVKFVRDPMDMSADDTVPGMGIQFEGLDPEARELILRFIRKRAPMFYDE